MAKNFRKQNRTGHRLSMKEKIVVMWLPKDSHLQWLKKEIVTIDGRKWADWSFVPMLKSRKDHSHNPVYTRNLTTSYKGQLLELNFTSNLNTDPTVKAEIDRIMKSVHLEE